METDSVKFVPPAHLAEEWDNPAMAEFKRQEAKERVAFGSSEEAAKWLNRLKNTSPPEFEIRLAPIHATASSKRNKLVRLNW